MADSNHDSAEWKLSRELTTFLLDVIDSGGRPLIVGGWVRDYLLGVHSKDIDFEIFNLPAKQLKRICRRHGRLYTVGAAFAVLKLTLDDGDTIDVSIPRREYQIGEGHRGFEIHADPTMSIEEAAQRRDLTVNAISMDPLTFEPVDPTGGIPDLKARVLRHVGPRFLEDPLRVLRVYQFQARLGFEIADETREICRHIVKSGDLNTLPRERIEEELRKMFLRGSSNGIQQALRNACDDGVIEVLFPELYALKNVPQSPKYHQEGNAFEHTIRTIGEASEIARRDNLDEDDAWTLTLTMMIHDLGKTIATQIRDDGRITSHGHDTAGQELGEQLLRRITQQTRVIDHTLALARNHMRPMQLAKAEKVTNAAIRRLSKAVKPSSIDMLCRVNEADTRGSIRDDMTLRLEASVKLRRQAEQLGVAYKPPTPVLQGRHLMKLAREGFISDTYCQGGKHFGPILDKVYQAQLNGTVKTIENAMDYLKSMGL